MSTPTSLWITSPMSFYFSFLGPLFLQNSPINYFHLLILIVSYFNPHIHLVYKFTFGLRFKRKVFFLFKKTLTAHFHAAGLGSRKISYKCPAKRRSSGASYADIFLDPSPAAWNLPDQLFVDIICLKIFFNLPSISFFKLKGSRLSN